MQTIRNVVENSIHVRKSSRLLPKDCTSGILLCFERKNICQHPVHFMMYEVFVNVYNNYLHYSLHLQLFRVYGSDTTNTRARMRARLCELAQILTKMFKNPDGWIVRHIRAGGRSCVGKLTSDTCATTTHDKCSVINLCA